MRLAADEVIEELVNGQPEFLGYRLRRWSKRSPGFGEFLERNRSHLTKRLNNLRDPESIRDILYELEIGYLFLLEGRSEVLYEELRNDDGKGPDFTITRHGRTFNIEVKRIREADEGFRFDRIVERLRRHFAAVQSPLHVSVDYVGASIAEDFLDRLERRYGEIQELISVILDKLLKGPLDSPLKVALPGFEGEIQAVFSSNPIGAAATGTSLECGIRPCFYTGEEWEKFFDAIYKKLDQLIPDMTNIVVINTDSSTHDKHHLQKAIDRLQHSLTLSDALRQRSRQLSGVVFHNQWVSGDERRNFVWKNPEAANQISYCLSQFLAQMSE